MKRFDGLCIEALTVGHGEPLLMLHGFPDLPTSMLELASHLTAFECCMPYMPGYPPSSTVGPYDVETLAQTVATMAADLGERVHLVGHDWGSVIAQVAMMRHPQRFGRAVIMSVPHLRAMVGNALRSPRQLYRSRYMAGFQIRHVAERRVTRVDYLTKLYSRWSPGLLAPDHIANVAACLAESGGAPLAYYRQNMSVAWTRMPPITVPTLYLHGADDGCIAPEMARGQERFFTGDFRSEVIPNAGHFLQLDAPEIVARAIREWLNF